MSFSKALLGLAAASVFSTLASAQTLSCIAQPVDTPALRDNGVTERVGDLKIVCTGGTPTAATQVVNGQTVPVPVPQFNLQIFTSPAVNVTSRLLGGDVSEALLLIDEPTPAALLLCGSTNAPTASSAAGTCPIQGTGNGIGTYDGSGFTGSASGFGRPNAFAGRKVGDNSIVWNGIPFDPPGTGPARVLRLTNIRLNASQLNNVRGGATSVNIIISTTSSGVANSIQVPIGNPAPTVGIAQTPLDFSTTSASFLQCESQNVSSATGLVSSSLASGDVRLGLSFTERFASALRRRSAANASDLTLVPTPASSNQLTNTQLFETESGFYNANAGSNWNFDKLGFTAGATATNIGLADTGTRLLARFKNLPSGATFYAGNHAKLLQVGVTPSSANNQAITGDVHGTGAADANCNGTYSSVGSLTGITAVTATSGAASFCYEVIATNTTVTEFAKIPVALAYVANTSNNLPTLGSATADGQLAPLSTTATASATASIPRFVEDTVNNGKALFTINACRSNLLFPFIVNGGGYETGMAIVNTTKDPWGTQSQTGNCTVVFYGRSGTSDVCLTQQSNKTISGGQFLAWTLGGGGDVPATPNFTGYAIAQCNFQYGHGFAFITDTRVERVAHGYLALVLDDPIGDRGKRTGSKSEVLGN
jgi:hypothetical protein